MSFRIIGSGRHLKASELRALLVRFHTIYTGRTIYNQGLEYCAVPNHTAYFMISALPPTHSDARAVIHE